MSMTLGFDVLGTLERVLDADRARDVNVAIAKHAPAKSSCAGRSSPGVPGHVSLLRPSASRS